MILGYEAKRVFHNRSGLGNYGRNLIRALAEHQPDNQYLLYNYKAGPIPFAPSPKVHEIRPPQKGALLAQLWRQRLVSGRAARDGVAIFHGLSAELPYGLPARGIRSVVTVHDLIFKRFPHYYQRVDRNLYLRKLNHACRIADRVVAVSRQTRADLIHFLGVPAEKILVVHQGCAPAFWEKQEAASADLRQRYQLPEEYVLFVGTLEPRKNPVLVAQACAQLNIPLVLVGRATRYWQKFLRQASPTQQKILHHRQVSALPDLAALYQNAQCLAYPSQFEGFGIPLLEALAGGTPVITADNSALPEVAGPGGLLLDEVTAETLIEALQLLWRKPEKRAALAAAGRGHVQQFTDAVLARQWQGLYQEMLAL